MIFWLVGKNIWDHLKKCACESRINRYNEDTNQLTSNHSFALLVTAGVISDCSNIFLAVQTVLFLDYYKGPLPLTTRTIDQNYPIRKPSTVSSTLSIGNQTTIPNMFLLRRIFGLVAIVTTTTTAKRASSRRELQMRGWNRVVWSSSFW